jgi:hypothetical protein
MIFLIVFNYYLFGLAYSLYLSTESKLRFDINWIILHVTILPFIVYLFILARIMDALCARPIIFK